MNTCSLRETEIGLSHFLHLFVKSEKSVGFSKFILIFEMGTGLTV